MVHEFIVSTDLYLFPPIPASTSAPFPFPMVFDTQLSATIDLIHLIVLNNLNNFDIAHLFCQINAAFVPSIFGHEIKLSLSFQEVNHSCVLKSDTDMSDIPVIYIPISVEISDPHLIHEFQHL